MGGPGLGLSPAVPLGGGNVAVGLCLSLLSAQALSLGWAVAAAPRDRVERNSFHIEAQASDSLQESHRRGLSEHVPHFLAVAGSARTAALVAQIRRLDGGLLTETSPGASLRGAARILLPPSGPLALGSKPCGHLPVTGPGAPLPLGSKFMFLCVVALLKKCMGKCELWVHIHS